MSTAETRSALPPLIDGQRLDRATFHARYCAMPPNTRAELVSGIVFMASPLGYRHGRDHAPIIAWLTSYVENTPGVQVLDNATVILDPTGEVQPDASLRIDEDHGGRSRVEGGYVRGGPELIVEVSDSSRSFDLGAKRQEYERAGVLEYIVRSCEPDEAAWHVRHGDQLVRVEPDGDGTHRSRVFPGLWLDVAALLAGDTRRLRAAVERGVATAEHAAFVERLRRVDAGPNA